MKSVRKFMEQVNIFCVFVSHAQRFLIAILQNFIQKKTSPSKSTIALFLIQLGRYIIICCVCVHIHGCDCECVYIRTSKMLRLVHLSIL